jgi:hypothetical protein
VRNAFNRRHNDSCPGCPDCRTPNELQGKPNLEVRLAQAEKERDEARGEVEKAEKVHADEIGSADADAERLQDALEQIADWDAGQNLDYRQHFLNLQGIASSALHRALNETASEGEE